MYRQRGQWESLIALLLDRAEDVVHRLAHIVPEAHAVAEHVGHGLTLLLMLHPGPSVDLIRAWTFHDTGELKTGDIPAPTKWASPALNAALSDVEAEFMSGMSLIGEWDLTNEDRVWLKAIDYLELHLWCRDQVLLGNQHALLIDERITERLLSDRMPPVVRRFVELEAHLSLEERCFE